MLPFFPELGLELHCLFEETATSNEGLAAMPDEGYVTSIAVLKR
jgi:hypothetical protein